MVLGFQLEVEIEIEAVVREDATDEFIGVEVFEETEIGDKGFLVMLTGAIGLEDAF